MKTIINAFFLGFCFLCISNSAIYAQITQWPVEVKGSRNGAGTPKQLTYGYNPEAITSFKENKIGKKPKKNAKPAKIHFKYKAFDASQIV
ncbi:MAG: hypothetical protein K9G70_13835, partial [Prolixibacteraceae bacterium]|nr:hypothetical protein [Prolixibacteraceae bacterium]